MSRRRGRPPVVDATRHRRHLPVELAARLDEARRRCGLTYTDLSRLAGISLGMAWYVCAGERVPSQEYAARIACVLRLDDETLEWLMAEAVIRAWPDG